MRTDYKMGKSNVTLYKASTYPQLSDQSQYPQENDRLTHSEDRASLL